MRVYAYKYVHSYTHGSVLEKTHQLNPHGTSEVAVSRLRLLSGALRKETHTLWKPARLWENKKKQHNTTQHLSFYGPCFCQQVKAPSAEDCVRLKQTWKGNKDSKLRVLSCQALSSTMLDYVQCILGLLTFGSSLVQNLTDLTINELLQFYFLMHILSFNLAKLSYRNLLLGFYRHQAPGWPQPSAFQLLHLYPLTWRVWSFELAVVPVQIFLTQFQFFKKWRV